MRMAGASLLLFPSTLNYQLSTINYQLLTINYQLSPSAGDHRSAPAWFSFSLFPNQKSKINKTTEGL